MVAEILLLLLRLAIVIIALYFIVRVIRRIIRKDAINIPLTEAEQNIDDILKGAKTIPSFDSDKLKKARDKIKKTIKEGEKEVGKE